MTSGDTIKVLKDAMARLRADYPELLDDIARGERVFWIGAGVSRDQVPGLEDLLRRVFCHLRDQIAPGDPTDAHLMALQELIEEYLPSESVAFADDPKNWVVPPDLSFLTTSYSKILGTEVGTEPQDYLLWVAVDVRETYGSPDIQTGPDHELIAILVHEGLLEDSITTNWDGLIEKAILESTIPSSSEPLAVLMSNASFRLQRGHFRLYKPHGCAVLARSDESNRAYIVARTYDIATWSENPIFCTIVARLRDLAKNRKGLMLGSSVQDFNLLNQIGAASQDMRWSWTRDDPAYLFAEPAVNATHRAALEVVYREEYAPNRADICAVSATGMFAGVLLAATVVHVLFDKLKIGAAHGVAFTGSTAVLAGLEDGLASVEEYLLVEAGEDRARLVELIRSGMSSLVQRFFEPTNDLVGKQYKPIYDKPLKTGVDTTFKHLGLPELAVALGLVGLGHRRGHWEIVLGTGTSHGAGMLGLTSRRSTATSPTTVIVTRGSSATDALKSTHFWANDPSDVLILQATDKPVPRMSRGLGGGLGSARRGSRPERRVVWLADLARFAADPDELMKAFRAEVSL